MPANFAATAGAVLPAAATAWHALPGRASFVTQRVAFRCLRRSLDAAVGGPGARSDRPKIAFEPRVARAWKDAPPPVSRRRVK